MNTFFSTISKEFTKALILGSFLPVVLATVLWLLLVYPLFPDVVRAPEALKRLSTEWQLTWSTIIVVVASAILNGFNTTILRLYQGYPWRHSILGWPMTKLYKWRYRKIRAHRDRLWTILDSLKPDVAAEAEASKRLAEPLRELTLMLNSDYPFSEEFVLPTKFGNVLRNVEDYSRERYGISAVPLWPRLVAVIDSKYAALIDDLKTALDFAVNLSFLMAVLAITTLCLSIQRWQLGGGPAGLSRTALFVAISILAYQAAIARARNWGTYVKSAIDLYRRKLLEQLGYQHTLQSTEQEKADIWGKLASQLSYADVPPQLPYVPEVPITPATAVANAKTIVWIARGLGVPSGKPYAKSAVTIQLRNTGQAESGSLSLTDTIPANWTYVWGSAQLLATPPKALTVATTAPFSIEVPSIAAGQTTLVIYDIQSLQPVS